MSVERRAAAWRDGRAATALGARALRPPRHRRRHQRRRHRARCRDCAGCATRSSSSRDFASGTSSRSSKLIHGGLRYLEQGDVRLVLEATRERERLRRLAPHLVRPHALRLPDLPGGPVGHVEARRRALGLRSARRLLERAAPSHARSPRAARRRRAGAPHARACAAPASTGTAGPTTRASCSRPLLSAARGGRGRRLVRRASSAS